MQAEYVAGLKLDLGIIRTRPSGNNSSGSVRLMFSQTVKWDLSLKVHIEAQETIGKVAIQYDKSITLLFQVSPPTFVADSFVNYHLVNISISSLKFIYSMIL